MIKTVDTEWLWRRAKALYASNMRKYRYSHTAGSIDTHLSGCIISVDGDTMEIDYDKYKQLRDEEERYAGARGEKK